MIESTCIQFYNIVMEDERAISQQVMTEMQNAGWQIVTVFPWNMGQIGVVYTRQVPQTNNFTGDTFLGGFLAPITETPPIVPTDHIDVNIPEKPVRRTRKPRKQS